MSISLATLGMFNPCIQGNKVVGGGAIMKVPEEKIKPIVRLLKIISKEEGETKKKIEVTVIKSGD
mgnify:CR=1 FL=1